MFRALSQRFNTISSANSISFSSENKTHVHGRKERERERDWDYRYFVPWYECVHVNMISGIFNIIWGKWHQISTILVYAYLLILYVHTCTYISYIYIYACWIEHIEIALHFFLTVSKRQAWFRQNIQIWSHVGYSTELSGALPLDAQRLQHTCLMQSHLPCARLEATKMSMLLASWKFQACVPNISKSTQPTPPSPFSVGVSYGCIEKPPIRGVLGGLKVPLRKSHTRLILRWASTYRWIWSQYVSSIESYITHSITAILRICKNLQVTAGLRQKRVVSYRDIKENIVNDLLKDVAFSCNPPMFRSVTNGAVKKKTCLRWLVYRVFPNGLL